MDIDRFTLNVWHKDCHKATIDKVEADTGFKYVGFYFCENGEKPNAEWQKVLQTPYKEWLALIFRDGQKVVRVEVPLDTAPAEVQIAKAHERAYQTLDREADRGNRL